MAGRAASGERGAEDGDGLTALHVACGEEHLEVARWLVEEKGMDDQRVTSNGRTALHIACKEGQLEVARWLAEERGHDADPSNGTATSPFFFASCSGHLPVVRWLFEWIPVEIWRGTGPTAAPSS